MKLKKISKLLLVAAGMAFVGGVAVTTTACSQGTKEAAGQKAINSLIFEKDNLPVDSDINLATTIGSEKFEITWTSSNTSVVEIVVSGEGDAKTITAVIHKPDQQANVTLTATIKEKKKTYSKEFTVIVNPYSVYDFTDKFVFEKKGQIIWEDFEAPNQFEIEGKSCPIEWTSSNNEIISFSDGVGHVVAQENKTKVTVTATFTYDGETSKVNADVFVWHELSETEKHNLFYDELGENTFDIMGYVVAKAAYNPSYKNGNVFLANTTLDGGYYCYRVVMEEEEWNKVTVGTRLLVKAAKSTSYNGLIETTGSQKGEIITDDSVLAPLSDTGINKLLTGGGVSVDNEFVLNYGLTKKTGMAVSLDGWIVKSIGTATAKDGGTILTVSRGEGDAEVTVDLVLNKYSVDLDSDNAKAIIDAIAALELKVGDRVRISGGLYCTNNVYQIHAINSYWAAIKSGKTDDSSSEAATKVLAEKARIDAVIPTVVVEDKQITLPSAEADDVTISYNLENTDVATLENNELTITPTAEAVKFNLEVTIAVDNGFSYTYTYQITTKIATDEDMVNDTLDEFSDEVQEIKEPKAISFAETGTTFDNVQLTYEITKGASSNVFIGDDDRLVIYPTTTAQEIEVTVTATLNATTATKVIKYTVPAYTLTPLDATFAKGSYYYITGTIDSIASDVYGNMYIKDTNGNQGYIYGFYNVYEARYDKLAVKPQVGDTILVYGQFDVYGTTDEFKNVIFIPTDSFVANYEANKVKATLEAELSGTVTTPKEIEFELDYSQATIDLKTTNAIWTFENNKLTITPTEEVFEGPITFEVTYGGSTVIVTKNFKATTNVSAAEKVAAVIAELEGQEFTAPGTYELATVGQAYSDVTIGYSNMSVNAAATLEDGKKLVIVPQATDVTFTVTATVINGSESDTKELTYTVKAYTITPLTAEFTTNENYYVQGTVSRLLTGSSLYGSFFIKDADGNEFEIYKVKNLDGSIVAKADSASTVGIAVGNKVVAYGYYSEYYSTKEICEAYIVSNEEPTPVELLEAEKESVLAQLDNALGTDTITSNKTITISLSKESMSLSLVGDYTIVSLEGNVLTITPTTEELSTTLTLRITYSYGSGQLTKDVTKSFVTKKDETAGVEVTAAYSGATGNMDGTNQAALVGLDATIFSFVGVKNSANQNTGLNQSGEFRLYGANGEDGSGIDISVATGYTIEKIVLNFSGTVATLDVNGTEYTPTANGSLEISIGGSSVSMKDVVASGTTQCRIKSIVITYKKV